MRKKSRFSIMVEGIEIPNVIKKKEKKENNEKVS